MGALILIRHGSTAWTKASLRLGSSDIPLDDDGVRQARELAQKLLRVEIKSVFSSDLQRAVSTAEFIARPHQIQVVIDPRLRERDHGKFEGTAREVIDGADSVSLLSREEAESAGVESLNSVYSRVMPVYSDLLRLAQQDVIAVVSHYGPLRIMLAASVGLGVDGRRSFDIACGAHSVVRVHGSSVCLAASNVGATSEAQYEVFAPKRESSGLHENSLSSDGGS